MTVKIKPRVGSAAWEEQLAKDPRYIEHMIEVFQREAETGKKEAVERLNRWLDWYPEHRGTVPALADLTAKVEGAWAKAVSFGDPLAEEAARREAEGLKAELLTPDAGFVERILASTVAVGYLAQQHASGLAAVKTTHSTVRAARDRRQTVAQRRFLDALKGWATHRKLCKSLRAKPLKIYRPHSPAAKAG